MRIDRKLIALAIVGSLGLAAVPAHADSVIRLGDRDFGIRIRIDDGRHGGHGAHVAPRREHARLAPHQIRRILRRSGFREISPPQYRPRGDVYVVHAENRRNRDVRIRVDADTGRILNVARLDRGPRHGHPGRGDGRGRRWN